MTKNLSYFIDNASGRSTPRQRLEGTLEADILIVGAGISGLSTAYELSKKIDPSRITLIDSGHVGFSTTGLSSGLLVDSVEEDFCDTDPKTHAEVLRGQRGIIETVEREKLNCDLRRIPSLYLANDCDEQADSVKEEYDARVKANFPVKLLDRKQIKESHGLDSELAMRNDDGYCFDPALFCNELARVLESRGVKIYEDTKLTKHDPASKIASTPSGNITYQKIVLTNGNTQLDHQLGKKAMLLSTSVAVTEPLGEEEYQQTFGSGEFLGWDASEVNYMYFRPVGNNQILIGGSDRLVPRSSADKPSEKNLAIRDRAKVRELFEKTFPQLKHVKFSHEWGGVIPTSVDGFSFVGETSPDHYVGLYGGGLPICYRAGQILSQEILDSDFKTDAPFSADRKIPPSKRIRSLSQYKPFATLANKIFFS